MSILCLYYISICNKTNDCYRLGIPEALITSNQLSSIRIFLIFKLHFEGQENNPLGRPICWVYLVFSGRPPRYMKKIISGLLPCKSLNMTPTPTELSLQDGHFRADSTLGALLIGLLFSCLLFGISSIQTYTYFSRFHDDGMWLKTLVRPSWKHTQDVTADDLRNRSLASGKVFS